MTLYQFSCVCTWLEIHWLRSIYHASRDSSEFGFYLCSVAKSRLWCIVCVCVHACVYIYIYVWGFCKCCHSRVSHQAALTKGLFLMCVCDTNSPRLDRWPRNQLFSPHCTTRAQSGMAVITIPASPHWAIPLSVEHIANVITLCCAVLWADLMSSACHLRARCHSKSSGWFIKARVYCIVH